MSESVSKSVRIKLYGGPYDGAEIDVEGHCAERVFPRSPPEATHKMVDKIFTPEPMYVYVYRRNTFAYRYEFIGVQKR